MVVVFMFMCSRCVNIIILFLVAGLDQHLKNHSNNIKYVIHTGIKLGVTTSNKEAVG